MNLPRFSAVSACLLILALVAVLAGCSKTDAPREALKGKVLVTVNGDAITDEELLTEYAGLPDFAKEEYAGESGLRKFLDELVTRELLYQKALEEKLDQDADFQQGLLSYRKARLSAMLIEQQGRSGSAVTDDMVKQYFEENQEDFQLPEKIQVAHILTESKDEAEAVFSALKKGASFSRVAREKSIDRATAEKGGELAPFSRGTMVPEFEAVAFKLQVNEVSMPVRTEFGYHVIKLLNRFAAQQVEYDRISDFIRSRMEDEIRQQAFSALSENLKKSASISGVDENVLKAVEERMPANPDIP